jgi:hypothetical protein
LSQANAVREALAQTFASRRSGVITSNSLAIVGMQQAPRLHRTLVPPLPITRLLTASAIDLTARQQRDAANLRSVGTEADRSSGVVIGFAGR